MSSSCSNPTTTTTTSSQQKSSISYSSLYTNPLNDTKHNRSSSEGDLVLSPIPSDDNSNKENAFFDPNKKKQDDDSLNKKDRVLKPTNESMSLPATTTATTAAAPASHKHIKSLSKDRVLKPSSLHFCMQMHDNVESSFGLKSKDSMGSENSNSVANSVDIWDYSDSEAAPASSWSTLPNRTLLCRPLPVDIGKCTCVILREDLPNGVTGGRMYSLYTNEGKGRQDRKLAVASFKRHKGRSVYTISQSTKGTVSNVDDNYIGVMTANLMGSNYHIWNQGFCKNSVTRTAKSLLAVITFVPTITTWTGSYRTMRAYIPKHQSMQLKNTAQIQHIGGLPKDWEERVDKVHQLISKAPHYNKFSKQYELDFRDRGRAGLRIQRSVKNFQLNLGENGKQTILQLGRVGKSKYVMDYRYPLTGYQAFCICLASIDTKLCCTM